MRKVGFQKRINKQNDCILSDGLPTSCPYLNKVLKVKVIYEVSGIDSECRNEFQNLDDFLSQFYVSLGDVGVAFDGIGTLQPNSPVDKFELKASFE